MRVGEAVGRALRDLGVQRVFGIPGVHTIELYRGLHGAGIDTVTARHEQGAAFMADGAGRVTGMPGVCALITGPGVTNALTPVAQAHHDSVPMIVLASTTERRDLGRGRGPLHDLPDQSGLLAWVTSSSETVLHGGEALEALARAWRLTRSGRPRPVHVAYPVDLLGEEAPATLAALAPQEVAPRAADPDVVQDAADLLARARRPVLLLGGGAVDAATQAVALADRLGAPVALTGNGKGVVASDHPLCLGTTLPFPGTRRELERADVAVLVGTELSDVDVITGGGPLRFGGDVVRVDVDAGQLDAGVRATFGLQADAALALEALIEALPASTPADSSAVVTGRVREAWASIPWPRELHETLPWLAALERALPRERTVALDSSQMAYAAQHALGAYVPRGWLAPYGFGTLGPALPMAVGAALAAPSRATVALAGDGGLLFTVAELATAVDLALPLPIVVWDNKGYGEIRTAFDAVGAPRVGTETSAYDLLGVARGFGCAAVQVDGPDELERGVRDALDADRPTVLRIAG